MHHYSYIFCWGGKPLEVRSCGCRSGLEKCCSVSKLASINTINRTPQLLGEDLGLKIDLHLHLKI